MSEVVPPPIESQLSIEDLLQKLTDEKYPHIAAVLKRRPLKSSKRD